MRLASVLPTLPTQGWVRLIAPPAGKSTRLKELSGVVRATAWSDATELATVGGLDAASAGSAVGLNGTLLAVKVVGPVKGDPAATLVEITLQYDPAEAVPDPNNQTAAGDADDGVWIGQGPGGQAVPLPSTGARKPAAPDLRNPYGLRVTDAAGKPFRLSDAGSTVTQQSDGLRMTVVARLTYTCRPATAEPTGGPAAVAVRGIHLRTLSVPFRLTDVPLTLGTGTGPTAIPVPRYSKW